ncbi:hypothetical protein Pyn_36547 [Prunus yedoensis var. nudiflora]|uniref:At1g61320/AtMIF1 LRR domain-containing protein n=1 Tax=Prunus yedoensis var. nudiflora TaxID=2094558 RepID=A0A314YFX4_PRUYE|nr:hypothetical protein Pyn_36547 [Prunus yedoensis var. nudiflora]
MLSLLTLKEAASTSILSRQWQYLWAFTMTLNFDPVNFEVGNTFRRFGELKRESRDQQSFRYIDWVNRMLEQHSFQNIERFRAHFFLYYRFKSSIDKWIQFCMERRVQILELEFLAEKSFSDEDYTFPQKLLGIISTKKGSALKQFLYSAWDNLLQSDIPSLYSCGYSIGFKSLKVLRLSHVRATEEFIEYLLSNSPVLERLSLNAARGLVNLGVVDQLIALTHLVIKHCPDLHSIEIFCTNIVSFIIVQTI